MRRTKIVATLGPATDDDEVLEGLIREGADVVRINFSHGAPDDHFRRVKQLRRVAEQLNLSVGVLGDLQGPKIRIESFADGPITLEEGDRFVLDTALAGDAGTSERVGVTYKNLTRDVRRGDTLLLDDGALALWIEEVAGHEITTRVVVGGELSDSKGVNRQGGGLSAAALTEKDREDIRLAVKLGVDYLAVSFARDAGDLELARELMRAA
ncbi:MAG: pyruvate kinase, partial [Pseudomonadota bacterium]|nr:pyruvate kinase [Pseudomonadota bacterium]